MSLSWMRPDPLAMAKILQNPPKTPPSTHPNPCHLDRSMTASCHAQWRDPRIRTCTCLSSFPFLKGICFSAAAQTWVSAPPQPPSETTTLGALPFAYFAKPGSPASAFACWGGVVGYREATALLKPPQILSSRPKHDGFMSCAVERSPYWLLLLLLLLLVLANPRTSSTFVILSVANGPLYWLLLLRLPLSLLVFRLHPDPEQSRRGRSFVFAFAGAFAVTVALAFAFLPSRRNPLLRSTSPLL